MEANPVLLMASLLATHAVSDVTPQHARAYKRAYREVAGELGHRAPGRNLLRWGTAEHHPASDAEIVASLVVLERMLTPSATTPLPAGYSPPASPTPVSAGGSLPACTWAPESGGDWNAVNPTSGAYGRYQILPSTAAGYGCSLGSPAGQTACAQIIWREQGPSAWVNCG